MILPEADKNKDVFEVWRENWDVVLMFLRLQTQWNVVMGGYVGLRYEMLPWFCDLYSIEDRLAMVEGIRIMESAALKQLNKERK